MLSINVSFDVCYDCQLKIVKIGCQLKSVWSDLHDTEEKYVKDDVKFNRDQSNLSSNLTLGISFLFESTFRC